VQGYEREDNDYEACSIIAKSVSGEYMGTTKAAAAHDGVFKLGHLAGGKVTLWASCQFEVDTYVQSILVGGEDVLGEEVDSAVLAAAGLRVIMRLGAASVSGRLDLADPGEAELKRAVALLIPTDPRMRRAGEFRYMQVDRGGHFHSQNVKPGEYIAFVFDHVGGGSCTDEEFYLAVQGKGVRVSLAPGESKTLTLKLLPWPAQFADPE